MGQIAVYDWYVGRYAEKETPVQIQGMRIWSRSHDFRQRCHNAVGLLSEAQMVGGARMKAEMEFLDQTILQDRSFNKIQ